MKHLSLPVKAILALFVAGFAYVTLDHFNWIPAAIHQKSAIPTGVNLQEAQTGDVPAGSVAALPLPTTEPAPQKGSPVRMAVWAWNAQMGLFAANGGPVTTKGSLMEKHGVTLKITRQDDTEKTKAEQIKLAKALHDGETNPSVGVHLTNIMGDGAAAYLASINKVLEPLGPDYRAEIVGAVGYSRGEDGWWGPQTWKDDSAGMKGGATAGVLRDGDWNLAQYKLANDGIKNNPDATTWDPDAMNWFAADDYLKAVEMYVAGYCEDRAVVRDGRTTSEPKHHTCVQGVVTWTPGDVNLAKAKGGLVRLISTKENAYQMASVMIGIHSWNVRNAQKVEDLLAAAFEGADQVRSSDAWLSRAGQASYAIYAEQSPAYWVKYYKGVIERDRTQQPVPLGGSTVMNLADNLALFGLAEGSGGLDGSVFKAAYEGFGDVASQQYPKLMPKFPKATEAVNTTFLTALAQKMPHSQADLETFEDSGAPIAKDNVVASRNWSIQFASGSATFTPAAIQTLNSLYQQLLVGGALQVDIEGHTDNVGNSAANLSLSEARAKAVREWLQAKAPTFFPENRVRVAGFGDAQPIASNDTPDGRARNRRVTVVLGSKG